MKNKTILYGEVPIRDIRIATEKRIIHLADYLTRTSHTDGLRSPYNEVDRAHVATELSALIQFMKYSENR